jgi:hypothetical protein
MNRRPGVMTHNAQSSDSAVIPEVIVMKPLVAAEG